MTYRQALPNKRYNPQNGRFSELVGKNPANPLQTAATAYKITIQGFGLRSFAQAGAEDFSPAQKTPPEEKRMTEQNNTNTNQSVKKLTMAGVLAAAIVLLTSVVSIPMPGGFGYINLGDAGVLLAGALLGGGWGALCAGAASALSDVLVGWSIYAPATFLIKGAVALVAGLLFNRTKKNLRYVFFYLAALIVPLGYFLYETILYGTATAIPNVAFNTIQCLIGAGAGHAMTIVLLRSKFYVPHTALRFNRTKPDEPEQAEPAAPAEIVREPKNGPDVVLIASRELVPLITKAGDLLSVQGFTARLVALDDPGAFERLSEEQRETFLPSGKPFVRVEDAQTTAEAIAQAALQAIRS